MTTYYVVNADGDYEAAKLPALTVREALNGLQSWIALTERAGIVHYGLTAIQQGIAACLTKPRFDLDAPLGFPYEARATSREVVSEVSRETEPRDEWEPDAAEYGFAPNLIEREDR